MSAVRVLAALALLAFPLLGQRVVWQQTGVLDTSRIGMYSAPLSDIDRDGYTDFAHMVRYFDPPTRTADFHIWIMSGRNGSRLRFDWTLAPVGSQATSLAPAGDVDGDGVDDYVFGWMDPVGIVAGFDVRSGADGHPLFVVRKPWHSYLGRSVLGGVDLDGNGRPDVLVTAPGESAAGIYGAIYAFAGDGRQIYRLAPTAQLSFGARSGSRILAKVGDVDRDGAEDFVAGGNVTAIASGAAILMSGRSGAVLQVGLDDRPNDNIGHVVAGCGDLDGDGTPDFMGAGTGAVVRTYSGRTGRPIHTWRGDPNCFGGSSLEGGVDVDRDGVPDVLAAGSFCGSMHALSGRDGSVIFAILNMRDDFGFVVALRDASTPYPRLAVSHPGYGFVGGVFGHAGRVLAYDSAPPGVTPFGSACRGRLAQAPLLGVRSFGDKFRITVHGAPPGGIAVLLVGRSSTAWLNVPLPMSLDNFGLPGCSLLTSIDVAIPTLTGTTGLASGYGSLDLVATLAGNGATTLYAQWACLGPAGTSLVALSDSVAMRIE